MITTSATARAYQAITITPAGPGPFSQPSAYVRCAADDCMAKLGFSRAHLDKPTVIALLTVKGWHYDRERFNPHSEPLDRPARAWCRDHTTFTRAAKREEYSDWFEPEN